MLDKELSTAVFKRDGWMCRHCRERVCHPHHVIYKSQGGIDALNNLITLCPGCHRAHHDGKLEIEILEVLEYNVNVKFIRMKGWKPK